MRRRSHLITGIVVSYLLNLDIPSTVGVAFGSILPDLDVKLERLRDKWIVGKLIPEWAGHRGITHWIGTPLLIFLISWLLRPSHPFIAKALSSLGIGWLSHVLTDALTPSGIPLAPLSRYPRIRLLPKNFSIKYDS